MVKQGRDVCRCGHPREAHQHYRAGTDCSLCPAGDCTGYVKATSLRARVSKVVGGKDGTTAG